MRKTITLFFLLTIVGFASSQSTIADKIKVSLSKTVVQKDTVKKNKSFVVQQQMVKDTLAEEILKLKFYKKNAHASYYADKFHGRHTTSGIKYDKEKYTAAHKKFPFGTKLKVTNQTNGKSVIVEVNDRGPFVKAREIDLSKRAFMEIANNKRAGAMIVTIEEVK
ncbi:septal ring lytic transglycosylase RlpA family protein [Flavobacterium acetivorans]|uniref:septal ring lytic transglycosylase RlpA family protein n=1 Tax=Flavobacterium acetivorans TaxID=2893883 RepID=UPI001E48A6E9|nr:septal ring lytic transglycosylase RlpA family protein [Flavobacterium sp. F-29]UFH36117.1 septal ring lytic transglycosylase RlpA family protein [Flavobacterium sp. F-29]